MDKYYKYKHIFSGASTNDDIIFLRNKCPNEDLEIVDTVIRCLGTHRLRPDIDTTVDATQHQQLKQRFSISQMVNVVNKLSTLKYKEDCTKYLDDIMNTNYAIDGTGQCQIQMDTVNKIISAKPTDTSFISLPKIDKECPHCGRINTAPLGTKYIVCGIDTLGILPMDNFENVCLNDWCFACGKKLCKNWYKNQLYNEHNRKHDGSCCMEHALKTGGDYPNDYCQCHKKYAMHSIAYNAWYCRA